MQLREDDANLASGQVVATTADAAVAATTLTIMPLQYGMLRGTNLLFQMAGMDTHAVYASASMTAEERNRIK